MKAKVRMCIFCCLFEYFTNNTSFPLVLGSFFFKVSNYNGTSPYGHLTCKKTSQLQSPWISPKLYSTVQITPCRRNKVTSPLRSLLPSPVGDHNSEVPLYMFTNVLD